MSHNRYMQQRGTHCKDMKQPVLVFFILLSVGCSSGVIVHDQIRAAELVVDFLSSLKSDRGIQLAYEWTDDSFKREISFADFSQTVSSLRENNNGADIKLTGYEVFGPKEALVVYASSGADEGNIYFKFSLVGTKSRDYYLASLSTKGTEFSKSGIYREYEKSFIIGGV